MPLFSSAFARRREIRVSLRRAEDGLTIAIEDDGIGWRGVGPVRGTGLGTKVMTAMASQLQATVAYEPVPKGTRARFRLKV